MTTTYLFNQLANLSRGEWSNVMKQLITEIVPNLDQLTVIGGRVSTRYLNKIVISIYELAKGHELKF